MIPKPNPTRRFREHRGSLHDALETTFEFETQQELFGHLAQRFPEHDGRFDDIVLVPYGDDDRIGWKDTLLISKDGWVLGFAEDWR